MVRVVEKMNRPSALRITTCDHEEFTVAVATRDGRGQGRGYLAALGHEERCNIIAHRAMQSRIAHDAFLEIAARQLELRLDQCNEIAVR